MTARLLGFVADDLSGAAECASHALLRVSRSPVVLAGTSRASAPEALDVLTVDTDSRRLDEAAAVRAVRAAAALVADAPVVVKKVDSLLRGHVGAEVAALADALGRVPVVAVANPALDRVVRGGVLQVAGVPLHHTSLWAVETGAPPAHVADALHPLHTVLVAHDVVTSGVEAVAAELTAAADAGLVAVCDAVTDSDLAVVHAAATRVAPRALLVGSGALAAVAALALPEQCHTRDSDPGHHVRQSAATQPRHGAPSDADAYAEGAQPRHGALPDSAGSVLLVLGTRAPGLTAQVAQLEAAHSAHTVLVQPDELLTDPERVRRHLQGVRPSGVVVVCLDPAAPADAARSRRLAEALADAVAPVVDAYASSFLSGGETARSVLDRLSIDALEVVGEVETGTVVSRRPDGRLVATRPGSFGDPRSLVRVADHLLGHASRSAIPHHTPVGATNRASTTPTTRATTSASTQENS